MSFDVIPLRVTRGAFINYTYLGVDRAAGVSFLVDPAWELATIERALRESETRCAFILLTHAHPDHTDLADTLATRLDVPVHLLRQEVNRSGFGCAHLQPIDDTGPLPFGRTEILPLWTPGHTYGSACFQFEDNLFTGDTLFAEGCGMCIGDGADPVALFRSLQRLKASLAPHTRIFPGHSYGQPPGRTFSSLLKSNLYLQFDRESDFVAYRMRRGQTGWANFK